MARIEGDSDDGLNVNSEDYTSEVMQRAREIHLNLSPEFPSFIHQITALCKIVITLPPEFCNLYMPMSTYTKFALEDEWGVEYETRYFLFRWIDLVCIFNVHKLLEGDALVFHLVHPFKFKVYIVRQTDFAKPDGTVSLPNSDIGEGETDSEEKLDSFVDFEKFTLVANYSCISKLPEDCKVKYYELCRSRGSYLHNNLLESISPIMASEIIGKTVDIADAIREFNLCTSQEDLAKWKRTLSAFDLLGMDVSFMCDRLTRLESLVFDPEKIEKRKRLMEFKVEQDCIDNEIRVLERELEGLTNEIEEMEIEEENHKLVLYQEANAPW